MTVTATPSVGYQLATVTVTPTESGVTAPTAAISGNTATFSMPASDVTVSATFSALPTYSISVTNGTASPTSAYEGQTVTLTPTIPSGKQVDWTNTTVTPSSVTINQSDYTFTMPGQAVTVVFAFEDIPSYIFYESWDNTTGTGGNDDAWSGSIASSTLTADNTGWTVENANGASQCAKFGTTSKKGVATTPSITVTDGSTYKLTFKAAAWNSSSEATTLPISATGGKLYSDAACTTTISSESLVKGAWTVYTVYVQATSSSLTITWQGNAASNSRFFLDEVKLEEVSAGTGVETYSITGTGTVTGGSVSATSTSGIAEGATVTITVTPTTGYQLSTLTVDGSDVTSSVSSNQYTFSMPGHDVAVSATFAQQTLSTETATYIFNTTDGLNALGITLPSSGAGTGIAGNTYTVNQVSLTSSDGTTPTRVWNSNSTYDLRVYKDGGKLTFAVSEGCTITSIVIAGSSISALTPSSGAYSEGTWTGSASSVTFTAGATIKINTITVTYTTTGSTSTVTTVEGIAAFKAVATGTVVRLHLSDSYNARVLHVEAGSTAGTTDAYVRDNTGAILMQGLTPNRPLAYNQHLAGWITGEYGTDANGMPLFKVEENTTTAFLVIADPITEAQTLPKTDVTTSDLAANLADWVVIEDITIDGNQPSLTDKFSTTGYAAPYTGAIVDVSAIVGGSDVLYPVSENEEPVLTYVVDSSRNFSSPSGAISGTTVRLERSFTAGVWTPLTVPFGIDDFDGEVMEYTGLEQGTVTGTSGATYDAGNMIFTAVSSIEAGKPYLVKSDEDISSMVLNNVTLSNTAAQAVSHNVVASGTVNPAPRRVISSGDTYTLQGTYSPTTLSTSDHTYKVITSTGSVGWASSENNSVDGTGAYISSPANQGVNLVLGDTGTSVVITGIDDIITDEVNVVRTGTFNMMGVKMPDDWELLPPGIYIVDGKKVIKQTNR